MRRGSLYILLAGALAGATLAGSDACAATGQVLLKYESALGSLPHAQGWTDDSHCLREYCPQDGTGVECMYQGGKGNDCTYGHGCGPDASPALRTEHFNAPAHPLSNSLACSYTEWLVFDNGEDYAEAACPVGLPLRNLTFAGVGATIWGNHSHPAFGAPRFINAPVGHFPLRLVTGSGVPGTILPASQNNHRNWGKLDISSGYAASGSVTNVTLIACMACGNHSPEYTLLCFSGLGGSFALSVDGLDGSATLGRFVRGTTECTEMDIFAPRKVSVAVARANVAGPHSGEFFTVRIVLNRNRQVKAWLNEDPATLWTGTAGSGTDNSVHFVPDEQSGTMWLDYVRVLEGEVLPPTCSDPAFDINFDRRVDVNDLGNGVDGFMDCATGPQPSAAIFDALSAKCQCHDVNHDRAIDMRDFAAFQRCLTGPTQNADPACDD